MDLANLLYYNNTNNLPGSIAFNNNYGLPNLMTNQQLNNLNSIRFNTYPYNTYNQGWVNYNRNSPILSSTYLNGLTIPQAVAVPQPVLLPQYNYGSSHYIPYHTGHSHSGHSHSGHSHSGHSHIASNGHVYTIPNSDNLSGSHTHDQIIDVYTSQDLIAHTITVEDTVNVGYSVTCPLFVGNLLGTATKANKLTNPAKICGIEFDGSTDIEITTSDIPEGENKYYTNEKVINSINETVTTKFVQDLHFNSTNANILPKVNYVSYSPLNLHTLWEGQALPQGSSSPITLKVNDTILVKDQHKLSQNGVYVINTSGTAATRADYFKKDITLNIDMLLYVENDKFYLCKKGTKINENDDIVFHKQKSSEELIYTLFKN